uniref:Uncharacterized protein n=1 Tax=Anoplophora glabripennis TaxID=217634 RepID=V5G5Z9_ANOGL
MDRRKDKYSVDKETGEILYPALYNSETGEYEGDVVVPQKIRFRIPFQEEEPDKKPYNAPKSHPQDREFIKAAVFLLPAAILLYPVVFVGTMLLETILHCWVHKINKTLKSDGVYYQSPLHGITKEFCSRCREFDAVEQIGKLQDVRSSKLTKYGLESIRRVVT